MKHNYTLSIFLLFSIALFAQPQFSSINCFQVNDSSKIGFAIVSQSFDDFIPATGNNYTWDFTTTGTPGPWTTWTAPTVSYLFQPSSQSIHSPFQSTEINEYAQLSFSRDLFYTYSSNQDTLYFNGLYSNANYAYKPSIPYLTFPLNYIDSVYSYTKQYANPNQPTNATGSVTRYWIYDGYGTVKLPYGTATDVYRVRTKQVDSSYIINFVTPYEEIIWFRQSDGIPILRFLKNGTMISAYFASVDATSSVKENNNYDTFSIYPNPAQQNINIKYKGVADITISDYMGKVIYQKLSLNTSEPIDVSTFPTGLYTITLQNKTTQYVSRFIKQ
ncbi:MAG: T9SS type A sorting domain-containing protein [Bacteroidia bacterium]